MTVFDRIGAAIALILAGAKAEHPELREHIDVIDSMLTDDVAHNRAVDANLSDNEDVSEDDAHVSVVHAGLQQIIAAAGIPTSTDVQTPSDSTSSPATPDTGNTDGIADSTPLAGGVSDAVDATGNADASAAAAPSDQTDVSASGAPSDTATPAAS